MLTRPQPTTASFAHRLLLLVLVAGVFDPAPGSDRLARHRIDVLFQASPLYTSSPVTAISLAFAGTRNVNGRIPHPGIAWRDGVVYPKQTIGRVHTRPLSSPCITAGYCNIPHQNADADETFVYCTL